MYLNYFLSLKSYYLDGQAGYEFKADMLNFVNYLNGLSSHQHEQKGGNLKIPDMLTSVALSW